MRGPVLVDFLRGSWDPNSRARLTELSQHHDRLRDLKCKIIAVFCERPGSLKAYLDENPVPFPVTVDEDRRVARAYGVWQRFSLPRGNIARPSSFLIDRCGYVRYAFVAKLQIHAADLEVIAGMLPLE